MSEHFRQRKTGSRLWEGRQQVDGRTVSVYAPTEAEAKRKLRDAVRTLEAGGKVPDQRRTTGQWLDTWLDTSVRPHLRPQTIASYEAVVKLYLKPHIGRVPIVKLSLDDIGVMMAALAKQPRKRAKPGLPPAHLSVRTQRYTLSILRAALNRAVEADVVTRNVARLYRPPRAEKPERRPFTPQQVATLFAYAADKAIGPLLIVSAATGMRQGEALALRWEDVDLDAGILRVQHTLNPHTHQLAATKTAMSRREVHLPAVAAAALREQRRRQLEDRLRAGRRWHDSGYVFATSIGTAQDARNVVRQYHAACEHLGLPDLPWHHLRHFAATALLAAGEDLFTVSRILGHTSVATTASFYGHVQPEALRGAASRMDALLTAAGT